MTLKRALLVGSALITLAVMHQVAVRRADAQGPSGQFVDVVGPSGCSQMAVTANGDCYTTTDQTNWQHTGNVFSSGVPSSGNLVVGVASTSSCGYMAITEGGDCYVTTDNGATWRRTGNVAGAPTAASSTSWGRVKAGYRK